MLQPQIALLSDFDLASMLDHLNPEVQKRAQEEYAWRRMMAAGAGQEHLFRAPVKYQEGEE